MICIGLDNPKNRINVGAVLRAAGCYGSVLVAASGNRAAARPAPTGTRGVYKRIPLLRCNDLRDVVPYGCVPVAVDLVEEATPLPAYEHPKNVFYVFGAEDNTLGRRVLSWCRDVVYVPTDGCMNLAACVNVVLYDRLAKQKA